VLELVNQGLRRQPLHYRVVQVRRWSSRQKLFVTLVTEVSLISRDPNLRFERISISRRFLWKLFVTLVTEVSLISRDPNLRFERISISRRFLWKSFSSFPFCTRHDCRRGLVEGYPKLAGFGPSPLFDSVRHFIVKHTPFESVVTSNDSI
jgi:hypothetical protein